MNNIVKVSVSWLIALWVSYIFLGSLPHKFSDAAEPLRHISSVAGATVNFFIQYGAYIVGGFELLTALVLLSPIVWRRKKEKLHCIGGLMASSVMTGAVFFHLATPLKWAVKWHENGKIQTDAGADLSILLLGLVLVWLNRKV